MCIFIQKVKQNNKDYIMNKINSTPKISVIIPVYNTELYLSECLNSVTNQTLKEIEIICINDGSTDNSLKILKEYTQKDERIKIIDQNNQGLSCSRNNAFKITNGEYVVFLDSDDYIDSNSLRIIYNQMTAHNLDMLSFSGVNFDSDTRQIEDNPYWSFLYLPKDFDTTYFNIEQCWSFLNQMAVSSCLTAYKTSFIKTHKLYFPSGLCFEDNLFFTMAITKSDRCGIIKDKLYFRRIHGASITQNWNSHFMDWIIINDLTLNYLQGLNIEKSILISNINSRCKSVLNRFNNLDKKDKQKYKKYVKILLHKYNFYNNNLTRHTIKSYILLFIHLVFKHIPIPYKKH